jgi:hypothetical protein
MPAFRIRVSDRQMFALRALVLCECGTCHFDGRTLTRECVSMLGRRVSCEGFPTKQDFNGRTIATLRYRGMLDERGRITAFGRRAYHSYGT